MTSPSTRRMKISRIPRNAPASPPSQPERHPAQNSSLRKSSHRDQRTRAQSRDHRFELPSHQPDLNWHVQYPLSNPSHRHRWAAQQESLRTWLRRRRLLGEQLHERLRIQVQLRELDEGRGSHLLPRRRKLAEGGRSVIQVIRVQRLCLGKLLLRRKRHPSRRRRQ